MLSDPIPLPIRTFECKGLFASPRPHTRMFDDGTLLTTAMFDACMTECSVSGEDEIPIGIDAEGTLYTMCYVNKRLFVEVERKTNFVLDNMVCAYTFRKHLVQALRDWGRRHVCMSP